MSYLGNIKPNAIFAIALALNVMLQPSYPAVIMFVAFLATVIYQAHLRFRDEAQDQIERSRIDAIFTRISRIDKAIEALNSDVESVRKDHTEAHRILEESKSLLSQNKMASAFTPKTKRL